MNEDGLEYKVPTDNEESSGDEEADEEEGEAE